MHVRAYNSGGRKVYDKRDIDLAIEDRPWQRHRAFIASSYPELADINARAQPRPQKIMEKRASLRLKSVNTRLRPYKHRKKKATATLA